MDKTWLRWRKNNLVVGISSPSLLWNSKLILNISQKRKDTKQKKKKIKIGYVRPNTRISSSRGDQGNKKKRIIPIERVKLIRKRKKVGNTDLRMPLTVGWNSGRWIVVGEWFVNHLNLIAKEPFGRGGSGGRSGDGDGGGGATVIGI